MKRFLCWLVLCLLALTPVALADDSGVLSEGELNAWIIDVLRRSAEVTPLNAPVGEESRTEEGYAFLYPFATLYYDKPVLDAQSVLTGVSVTDEGFASPRGIALGSPADALVSAYGWQNPMLVGDGSFAAFYRLNQLPAAAYWCWARHDGAYQLQSVQCAIHARVSDGRYTDAGIAYTVDNGVVSAIHVYGLNRLISEAEVLNNLSAVAAVDAAGCGDAGAAATPAEMEGWAVVSTAERFGENDLRFAGGDIRELTPDAAKKALGEPMGTREVQDGSGTLLTTCDWKGLSLTFSADGLETLSATGGAWEGPRGLRMGTPLADALALFESDGAARVMSGAALLYGDGLSAPYGLMAMDGEHIIVTYAADVGGATYSLRLTFAQDGLTEWMIYCW